MIGIGISVSRPSQVGKGLPTTALLTQAGAGFVTEAGAHLVQE